MIKTLDIQNFQSHKDTQLDFHPGVNVIIGTSDSGKTAVLRALRWVVYNKPTGEAFRRIGSKKTSVQLTINEDIITREKSTSTNIYQLNDQTYKAFGNDVPQDIMHVLNLGDINIQQQLDSPYLLSETPGEVARHFNRIAHLEKIDRGNSVIQSAIRKMNSSMEEIEDTIRYKKESLKKYTVLSDMETDVEVLESLEKEAQEIHDNEVLLESLILRFNKIEEQKKELEKTVSLETLVNTLHSLYGQRSEIRKKDTDLQKLVDNLAGIAFRKKNITKNLKEREIKLSKALSLVEDIKVLQEQKNPLQARKSILSDIIQRLSVTQIKIETLQKNITKAEVEFKTLMPDECPLCGQPIFTDDESGCDASEVDLY